MDEELWLGRHEYPRPREPAVRTGPVAMWDSTLRLALPHTNRDHAPGTQFLYSNIGYAILGATLGRAAGVPFIEWERQHILELGVRILQLLADIPR